MTTAAVSPDGSVATARPTSNECCAPWAWSKSARVQLTPRPAASSNVRIKRPRPGCGFNRRPDPLANCKNNSTGGVDHYNQARPHRALRGATPAEQWAASSRAEPGPVIDGPIRASIHTVNKGGHIGWSDFVVGIDSRLAGQRVLVTARDFTLAIYGQQGLLRRLTIDTSRRYQGTGRPPGRRR